MIDDFLIKLIINKYQFTNIKYKYNISNINYSYKFPKFISSSLKFNYLAIESRVLIIIIIQNNIIY